MFPELLIFNSAVFLKSPTLSKSPRLPRHKEVPLVLSPINKAHAFSPVSVLFTNAEVGEKYKGPVKAFVDPALRGK